MICLIVFLWYWFKDFIIELRQQLAPRVTFDRFLLVVFLSGQDLSPSIVEHVLFSLKLLLFLFQAP